MAARALRGYCSIHNHLDLDAGHPSNRPLPKATVEKGRNDVEGETLGRQFEFVRNRSGDCGHHHYHERF